MSIWGEALYRYYEQNGGSFRGEVAGAGAPTATLEFVRNGVRILLSPLAVEGSAKHPVIRGCAQISVELLRPYTLKVRKLSVFGMIGKKIAGGKDGHAVQTGNRKCDAFLSVESDNAEFTKTVFADKAFRHAALASDGFAISVIPVTEGNKLHTVTVSGSVALDKKGRTSDAILGELIGIAVGTLRAVTANEIPELSGTDSEKEGASAGA